MNTRNDENDTGIESEKSFVCSFKKFNTMGIIPMKVKRWISECDEIDWKYENKKKKKNTTDNGDEYSSDIGDETSDPNEN